VTTLELAADPAADLDLWVEALLENGRIDSDQAVDRLRRASFIQIAGAIERAAPPASAAARLYQQWIACQPADSAHLFAAWFNLGVSLVQSGNHAAAVTAYQTALALKHDFSAAAANLGLALETLGHPDTALQTWEQALQPDDARTGLLNHRARLLEQLGRLGQAEQEMRRSLLINPAQPDVIQHWVHIRQKLCHWPLLADQLPGVAMAEQLRHVGPLGALALSDDITVQRDAARDWVFRKTSRPGVRLSPVDGYRHDRLRIGYLSSDFCRHAMGYLIAELFERHDRTAFEVFGYCASPDDGSDIRARIMRSFDHSRRVRDMRDEQAARLIRDDEIDILIDLNGLTSGSRAQILRWKPAPVQATYLGFIGSVPIPELDYLFCDDFVIPPHLASMYQPQPLTIAENFQANDSKRTIGQPVSRASAGLPEDRFVFCCFSNHYKITEEIFTAWMSILRRAGDAILWLIGDNGQARGNMLRTAARLGVAADRILFAARVSPDEYMARLALPDVFLDTFPYNAGTIASDAIRMGLPLVTLSGQSFASRMAGRLLAAMGAHQGIAASVPQYIEIATRLATDRQNYCRYKRLFTAANWAGRIGDIATFAVQYEQTLLRIAKRPPRTGAEAARIPEGISA